MSELGLSPDPLFGTRFVLKRRLLQLLGQTFYINTPDGQTVLFAKQEGLRLKEQIRVFRDENGTQPVFGIFARQVFDFSGTYDVVDLTINERIGVLQRQGFTSMVRDTWNILDPWERPLGEMTEDTWLLAIVRRFFTNLVPQNYDVLINGQQVADFRQNFNPFSYHLHLDFSMAPQAMDRRLGLAAAICLAAIEGRQKDS